MHAWTFLSRIKMKDQSVQRSRPIAEDFESRTITTGRESEKAYPKWRDLFCQPHRLCRLHGRPFFSRRESVNTSWSGGKNHFSFRCWPHRQQNSLYRGPNGDLKKHRYRHKLVNDGQRIDKHRHFSPSYRSRQHKYPHSLTSNEEVASWKIHSKYACPAHNMPAFALTGVWGSILGRSHLFLK